MADIVLIIGNGFDLDMGVPSKYSDFILSPEWQKLAHTLDNFPTEDYRSHSLIYHLQQAASESNWFDIEEEIHQFVLNHNECTDNEVREIKEEFERLKKALMDYLRRVSGSFKADESKAAYQLLLATEQFAMPMIEINFNYTSSHDFVKKGLYYEPGYCRVTDVHGSLKEGEIVLGCNLQKGEKVNRQLSFMYKYNMLNKANHSARHLLEAKEIIIFGHSVNEMDFGYFKGFFNAASTAPKPIRHLTIITKDEETERCIKDNIQNQGISVTDLYNNLWTFEVIHTTKLYDKNAAEIKKWKDMIMRLSSKDRKGL